MTNVCARFQRVSMHSRRFYFLHSTNFKIKVKKCDKIFKIKVNMHKINQITFSFDININFSVLEGVRLNLSFKFLTAPLKTCRIQVNSTVHIFMLSERNPERVLRSAFQRILHGTEDLSFTLGIAKAGAIGKSIGSVAASWNAMTWARGVQPLALAADSVIKTHAAAPSFRVDALPAVTVPFSFWNN